jgi:hypothetical protein
MIWLIGRLEEGLQTAIVASYTLVLWHQENVQIRRHLKEQNVTRLYPTLFVQENT